MTLVRIGACNHCGACCCPPVMVENPMIQPGEDRCKFYTDNLDTGHCLIKGRANRPIEQVRDRYNNEITREQLRWFNENCLSDYPTVEDMEKGHQLPLECGFMFIPIEPNV